VAFIVPTSLIEMQYVSVKAQVVVAGHGSLLPGLQWIGCGGTHAARYTPRVRAVEASV